MVFWGRNTGKVWDFTRIHNISWNFIKLANFTMIPLILKKIAKITQMPPRGGSRPPEACISLGLCRVFGVLPKQCTRKLEIQKPMFWWFYMILHKITKVHEVSWISKKSMVCRRRRRNTHAFAVLGSVFGSPRTLNSMNSIEIEEYAVFSWNSSIFMEFHEQGCRFIYCHPSGGGVQLRKRGR